MLKRIIILAWLISLCNHLVGQEVYWANRLLGFSSERRPGFYGEQYRARQILGAPEVLPQTGDSPCAWSPAEADSREQEWIKVGFSKAIHPRQILIAENFNPGALVAVYAYDPSGKEYPIAEADDLASNGAAGRLLSIRPELPASVRINAVKIVMHPARVPGYNQIDAIGMTESAGTVQLEVEVAADLPADLKRIPLNNLINSRGREIAPVISPDGTMLYFTREHADNIGSPQRQDVWVSQRQANGDWGAPVNLGPPVNNAGDNAVLGISANGRTLYLLNSYLEDGTMVEGFSKSFLTRNGWSFPVTFYIDDHYNDQRPKNTEMTISPDEKVIILSVQRRDTRGSKDLYVSFRKNNSSWTAPVNLGSVVNTPDYEGAPFLAADNKTLYFTSTGHRGYGSGDIFMSRRLDDTWLNWSKPVNLGPVINTPAWDSFFTIPASGNYAYMSSYNPGNQSDDLYMIPLYPSISPEILLTLKGKISDRVSGAPVPARLDIKGLQSTRNLHSLSSEQESGDYQLLLPYDSTLVLTVNAPGFFPYREELNFSKSAGTTVTRNITLVPIRSGQNLPLKSVQFAQSSARLEDNSREELLEIVKIMKDYPDMEILLEGHTDNQGDFNKNLQLSEDRVKSVREFLIAQGIAGNRIRLKAWGSSRPITNNLTEDARKLNRRVELTVLKI